MKTLTFQAGECTRVRSYLDSYLNNDPLRETNQEMLEHLEHCADCASVMEDRARVKAQFKRAVLSETAPKALSDRIRRNIRRSHRSGLSLSSSSWMVAAVAAVVVFAVAIGVFYRSSARG